MTVTTARHMKAKWQAEINAGVITSIDELLARVSSCGFSIPKNGEDYITFKDTGGLKQRVYFDFPNPTATRGRSLSREKRRLRNEDSPGAYVYALVANSGTRTALYIGQTINLMSRMKRHVSGLNEDRTSGPLFDWAALHGSDVKVVILEIVPKKDQSTHDNPAYAARESWWFQRALSAGFDLPGSEKWGVVVRGLPPIPQFWPMDGFFETAVDIRQVAESQLQAVDLFLSTAEEDGSHTITHSP